MRNNIVAIVLILILIVLVSWIISIRNPAYLFSKKILHKNLFEVYYNDTSIDTIKLKYVLEKVEKKLRKSQFFNAKKRRLFICNNKLLYTFITPFNFDGLASNYVRKGNIFIASVSLDENLSKSLYRDYKEDLDKLLAHEITHSLLMDKGLHHIDTWKNEGYCEYIAYDKKINTQKDYNKYITNQDKYIKYRITTYYLLTEKKLSFTKIADSAITLENAYKELSLQFSQYE